MNARRILSGIGVALAISIPTAGALNGTAHAMCTRDDNCTDVPPLPTTPATVGGTAPTGAAAIVSYDPAVDDDLFHISGMLDGICEVARGQLAAGANHDNIVNDGLDVFADEGMITTAGGYYYLRGLIVGCLVAVPA